MLRRVDVSEPDIVLTELQGCPYTVAQLVDDIRTFFRTTNNPQCIYTQLLVLFPDFQPVWRFLANMLPNANYQAALNVRNRIVPFVNKLVEDHTAVLAESDQADAINTFKSDGACIYCTLTVNCRLVQQGTLRALGLCSRL